MFLLISTFDNIYLDTDFTVNLKAWRKQLACYIKYWIYSERRKQVFIFVLLDGKGGNSVYELY